MASPGRRSDDPSKTPQLSFYRAAPAGAGVIPQARRLGILSAAFNPITSAHVAIAQSAYHYFKLHEVLFVLPISQPHKLIHDAPIDTRLEMIALAVQDNPSFSIGTCTHGLFIDIGRAVERAYPAATQRWFITGRDAAERILTWPYPDPAAALAELFTGTELLVADREGAFALPEAAPVRAFADRIHHLPLPDAYSQVSATEIRRRVADGGDISGLVLPPVLDYMRAHGLYRGEVEADS
jgi:nicotinate-nucleotide adenylyltransferase